MVNTLINKYFFSFLKGKGVHMLVPFFPGGKSILLLIQPSFFQQVWQFSDQNYILDQTPTINLQPSNKTMPAL